MTPEMASILLTPEEINKVSGGYEQPRKQLAKLHALGFFRADLDRFGRVRLERAHYEAVCSGAVPPEMQRGKRPQVQNVRG